MRKPGAAAPGSIMSSNRIFFPAIGAVSPGISFFCREENFNFLGKRKMSMIKKLPFILVALLALTWCPGASQAALFTNPNPLVFGDDIDGSGYFYPDPALLSMEFFDIAESSTEFNGSTFGFFFQNDPSVLIPIFDANDLFKDVALVSMADGYVYDVELDEVQNYFTVNTGSIGFYLSLDPASGFETLYTDPLLNPGETDVAGAFEVLGKPGSYLQTFKHPDLDTLLGGKITSGITPVPEPSSIFLLGTGLLGLAFLKKRK